MSFVSGSKPLGEPIASDNDRQRTESAHWNSVPDVDTARISRERSEQAKTGEKMRVPGKRVIAQCARGLGQEHRKSDECEGLPKLRRFEPEEKSKETAARSSKEARIARCPGSSRRAANLAVR